MNIKYRLYINAPAQEVFDLVDDGKNLKLWMDDLVETAYDERHGREHPVGARFTQKIREGRRIAEYAGEIVAYDPLCHLAMVVGNRQFAMRVDYHFVSDAGQTRLDYQAQMIEGSWYMRLTGRLFESFTRRILLNQMWRLKSVAESRQPRGQQTEELLAA